MRPILRGLAALAAGSALVSLAALPARAQDILGHVIVGYQGWFSNPNDGSPVGALGTGGNDHLNLETYPDMSDFPASEQFPTSLRGRGIIFGEAFGRIFPGVLAPFLIEPHTASPVAFLGTTLASYIAR